MKGLQRELDDLITRNISDIAPMFALSEKQLTHCGSDRILASVIDLCIRRNGVESVRESLVKLLKNYGMHKPMQVFIDNVLEQSS
jgi:hypothetical protein